MLKHLVSLGDRRSGGQTIMSEDKRLEPFKKLKEGKRVPWEKRFELIREQFPQFSDFDWNTKRDDDYLFGRVLRDVLKLDQSGTTGRAGPRPTLDPEKARVRLRQFMGKDYSYLSFAEAFGVLGGGRSYRHLVAKTGLNYTMVYKLMNGMREPDVFSMEAVAEAFGKHPSYFVEYRTMYVLAALAQKMSPELTVDLYRQLRGEL